MAAGIGCGGLALLGNLATDRFISRGPKSLFFLLLGDERCASGVAPSIASMCGTGIGTAFAPSPGVCAVISTFLVSILPLAVVLYVDAELSARLPLTSNEMDGGSLLMRCAFGACIPFFLLFAVGANVVRGARRLVRRPPPSD